MKISSFAGKLAERYGLNLTVVNEAVDPTFRFMTVYWDGQIRMDPSSPYAMENLIGFQHRPKWPKTTAVGKTGVSSQMMDRVTAKLGRQLYEVPVGDALAAATQQSGIPTEPKLNEKP